MRAWWLGCSVVLATACGAGQAGADAGAQRDAVVDTGSARPVDAGADAPMGTDAAGETDAGGGSDASEARTCAYGGGCDLLAQDCGPGRACVPTDTASTCIVAGAGGPDASCTASTDCQAGEVCLGNGTCEPLACAPSDCVVPRWVYVALSGSDGMPLPSGVGVCLLEGSP
jgi:hypothetical protein